MYLGVIDAEYTFLYVDIGAESNTQNRGVLKNCNT